MSMLFKDVVRLRHSSRAFLPTPVKDSVLHDILADAQLAPSNCNTQPWRVHIVSGNTKAALSRAMLADADDEHYTPDFSFDTSAFHGIYGERRADQGKVYYEAMGITRDDKEGRDLAFRRNLSFFNAPHVAFLFMPTVGDNVRVAADIGMYAQNFLLSLTSQGLAGVPQTILGFFSDTVRKKLDVSSDFRLLFGISFGYEDPEGESHKYRMGRAPICDSVFFHN
ncbi:nitroreductase [Kluyvera sp. STS39-E]|uniref:nitroreductase n=1 Tax=Enterobacteriaceae TaxID=543 RepID=UPI000E3ECD1A|nr:MULTISPECIES: nitroreductase [Citrobacter]MBD0826617.1 nitroreductase [Citrobacter sp. C1]RFU93339.1 nitroreductase [Citrobacter gillenii]